MSLETSKMPTIGVYPVLEKIAEGGMGTVYKARHPQTGQVVAIKVLSSHLTSNKVLVKRFEQEYRSARAIDHANIVRALDFGYEGGCPFMVMEFVDGESLGQKIERDGCLPETDAVRILCQVARGLYRAHKLGLIHRDIKPDNILLTREGNVKITDLGLVKEMDTALNLTRTGRGLGTPHFMAPEQFRNAKNADPRCDIYSLGATLYQMVTGELPFKSCGPVDAWMKKLNNDLKPARELVPGLSDRVDRAIRRSMSPDPNQRPANCKEFIDDLTGRGTSKMPTVEMEQQLGEELDARDLWYVVYKDARGESHSARGNCSGIRRSLKKGSLSQGSGIRISRHKAGPFEPMQNFPEFRDLAAELNLTPCSSTTPTPPATARLTLADLKSKPFTRVPAREKEPRPAVPRSAPQINLAAGEGAGEWIKWSLILGLTVASAIAGYFLLPILTDLRMH